MTTLDGLTPEALRHALGHFATGVTVITTRDASGAPVGTTANAVSSLSLDPPLVLVCLVRDSATLAALGDHGSFAINVLADNQHDLSSEFARRGADAGWEGVAHASGVTGSPRLHGVLATIDCDVERRLDGGDHEIVIGRVRDLETSPGARPLLFFRGVYGELKR